MDSNARHKPCPEQRGATGRVHARPRRHDDDYVEIDDEDRWSSRVGAGQQAFLQGKQHVDTGASQANRNLGVIPSLAKPVLQAANSLGNKLTDIALEFVPNTVDRSTVGSANLALNYNLVQGNFP